MTCPKAKWTGRWCLPGICRASCATGHMLGVFHISVSMGGCRGAVRGQASVVRVCVGSRALLLAPRLGSEAQKSNFPDTSHLGGTSSLPPSPQPPGPEPWLSRGWGIITILCVSGLGRHCCLFYPLTKARPAGPAVSEFLWPGEALLPFLPPTQESPAESASLLGGTTAVASGQVKGTWVTQHWEEQAEGSLMEKQRNSSSNGRLLLQHEVCRVDLKKDFQLGAGQY
jgi:hypothetical protein